LDNGVYLAVFQGIPIQKALLNNPCNNTAYNATLLYADEEDEHGLYADYLQLTAGLWYSAIVSIDDDELIGTYGIQVLPTRRVLLDGTGFNQPEDDATADSCSDTETSGKDSYWNAFAFVPSNIYLLFRIAYSRIDDNDFDIYSYTYTGDNSGGVLAPATCGGLDGNLIDTWTDDDVVYISTQPWSTYSIVLSGEDDDTDAGKESAIFFVFLGFSANATGVVSSTSTAATATVGKVTVASNVATATTGVATTGVATNVATTGATSTKTTTGSSTVGATKATTGASTTSDSYKIAVSWMVIACIFVAWM